MTITPLNIGYYATVVDLFGINVNLLEIELALRNNKDQLNYDQFQVFSLWDQAKDTSEFGEWGSLSLPSGWNGETSLESIHFDQESWSTTGMALLQPSYIQSKPDLDKINDIASTDPAGLPSKLDAYLINGKFEQNQAEETSEDSIFLGISTKFDKIQEQQTGAPAAVEQMLQASLSDKYLQTLPDVLIFSNHGGSYLAGTNGDGPTYDNDANTEYLQVIDLADKLKAFTLGEGKPPFELFAYDECLMANVETITELADATKYFVASQELIPGDGMDYINTLSNFRLPFCCY